MITMTRAATVALFFCVACTASELPKDLPEYRECLEIPNLDFSFLGTFKTPHKITLAPEVKKRFIDDIRGFYKKLDEARQKDIANAIFKRLDTSDGSKQKALSLLYKFVSYPDEVYQDCQPMLRILLDEKKGLKNTISKLEDDELCYEYCEIAKKVLPQLVRLGRLESAQQ
ncbi:MAG: hypothetical protein ABSE73_19295 [Planctomycetota bacterium]